MSYLSQFYKDAVSFLKVLKAEALSLQYPNFSMTLAYVFGVIVMTSISVIFFFVLDSCFGLLLRYFFQLVV